MRSSTSTAGSSDHGELLDAVEDAARSEVELGVGLSVEALRAWAAA